MILSTLEKRGYSLENPNVPIAEGFTLLDLLGGQPSITGKSITENTALNASAVWSAVNVIAGSVGSLPLKLYRRREDGGKEEERGHWIYDFVHTSPDGRMTAAAYRGAAQAHLLLRGNHYMELIRDGSRVQRGRLLNPNNVEFHRRGDEIFWGVDEGDGGPRPVPWEDMLHISGLGGDGLLGWSVLTAARESIGLGLSADEYAARYYTNAARPSGFLSAPEALKKETKERIGKSWRATQGGLENAHKVAVLEGGVTWNQMSLSAEDSQFLQSRQFQIREIARWFQIPPHKIGDLEDATFSNISEQQIQFMQDTLEPWLTRWEQACNLRLLTSEERQAGLFVEFVRDARLMGDPEKRGAFYNSQFNLGSITTNEIRAKENRNPVDGGDRPFIRLDMVPLDQAEEMSVEDRARLILAERGVETRAPEKAPSPKREKRGYRSRYQLRSRFLPVFLDAADRLVRGEIRDVRRKLSLIGSPDFMRWLEDYYFEEFVEFASRTMGPVFDAYAPTVATAAAEEIDTDGPANDPGEFASLYTESFTRRHAASSRNQLLALEDEEGREEIEQRLMEWDEGKPDTTPRKERIANREIVQLGDGVARATWIAGGITVLKWRTVSDSCPYCRRLNGRTVSMSMPFVGKGEAFEGDDVDTPLTPTSEIRHPPLHQGCDCIVTPG